MGFFDYIWPFEKKFSQIPCAREAGITGLLAGPALGCLTIIRFGHGRYAVKATTYGGFAAFWISFIMCRIEQSRIKRNSDRFVEAVKEGKID